MGPRFFRHGELHLVALALLESQPMHGYELMAELERLFSPRYRPSAGSIYPALEALEREGLTLGQPEGERIVYQLTVVGRGALEERLPELGVFERRTGVQVRTPDLNGALADFDTRVRNAAKRIATDQIRDELARAADRIESLPSLQGASS